MLPLVRELTRLLLPILELSDFNQMFTFSFNRYGWDGRYVELNLKPLLSLYQIFLYGHNPPFWKVHFISYFCVF